MISPREYQLEAIEAVIDAKNRGVTRQLICLPTGTGKTVTFAALAKELRTPTLIIAHREELIQQAKNKVELVWPEASVGVVMGENNEFDRDVVIASIQTVCRDKRLRDLYSRNFGLIVIDEAHHATSDSYLKVISSLGFMAEDPNKTLVGVTATAARADKKSLGNIFNEVVFERSITTMIKAGYLTDLRGKRILTQTDLSDVRTASGDFVEGELSEIVNTPKRNDLIVKSYLEHASIRKAITFCVDVAHSKDIANAFNAAGVTARAVYGEMPNDERREALKAFSEGKIQMLTNCNLLTEGYDEPSISCILMARPTKSAILYTQCVGRGTRLYPGKTDCLVIDFTDSFHDIGSLATLQKTVLNNEEQQDEEQPKEASDSPRGPRSVFVGMEVIGDFDFFEKSRFAWIPVKEHWQLSVSVGVSLLLRKGEGGFTVLLSMDDSSVPLSTKELPIGYAQGVAEDWVRRNEHAAAWASKDAAWRSSPATDKQVDTLTKMGFVCPPGGINKGEACLLISQRINERNMWKGDSPTTQQMYFLKTNGIPFDRSLTKGEAARLIARVKSSK